MRWGHRECMAGQGQGRTKEGQSLNLEESGASTLYELTRMPYFYDVHWHGASPTSWDESVQQSSASICHALSHAGTREFCRLGVLLGGVVSTRGKTTLGAVHLIWTCRIR